MSQPKRNPSEIAQLEKKPRLLTKSRFKEAIECPTKLFYTGKKEYANGKSDDPFLKALAKGGFQTGKLAQVFFGPGEEITERDYDKAFAQTRLLLIQDKATVFEASIRYQNHFIKVDVAKRDGTTLEIIEVKAKSWPPARPLETKEGYLASSSGFVPYLYDIAYQTWVAKKAFPSYHVIPYLCLLNKEAKTSIDGLNQFFKLHKDGSSFTVKTPANLSTKDLGESILYKLPVQKYVELILASKDFPEIQEERGGKTFEQWVEWLSHQYQANKKLPPTLSEACKNCEYRVSPEDYPEQKNGFDECWSDAGKAAANNKPRSFDVWGGVREVISKKKLYFLDELTEDDIKSKSKGQPYDVTNPVGGWTRHERRLFQIDHEKRAFKGAQVHPDLKAAIELPSPWHFIDFETAMVAIPFTKNKRPYEQIAFQFSHHVMNEDGHIEHKTQFLNANPGRFPNFDFVRALRAALSIDNGTVFRYADHENTVLNQIHDQLLNSSEPDKEELIQWIRTLASPSGKNAELYPNWKPTREFVDMRDYVCWFYWHPRMGGSNSIKAVLPAILDSSEFLKAKYSKAVYGRQSKIKSLNVDSREWVKLATDGSVVDPYSTLGPIFPDSDLDIPRNLLDDAFGDGDDSELRDGGAAMMAYCRLQFSDLSQEQRTFIENALLRYCELDTMAMVMIWEAWLNFTSLKGKQ